MSLAARFFCFSNLRFFSLLISAEEKRLGSFWRGRLDFLRRMGITPIVWGQGAFSRLWEGGFLSKKRKQPDFRHESVKIMKTIYFTVGEPYKTLILQGKKTVEGRLCKGKFSQLQVSDVLQFQDTGECLEIIALTHYPSFKAMLENEGLKHTLPGIAEIDCGREVYYQFYTPEEEKAFGVLAISIRLKTT